MQLLPGTYLPLTRPVAFGRAQVVEGEGAAPVAAGQAAAAAGDPLGVCTLFCTLKGADSFRCEISGFGRLLRPLVGHGYGMVGLRWAPGGPAAISERTLQLKVGRLAGARRRAQQQEEVAAESEEAAEVGSEAAEEDERMSDAAAEATSEEWQGEEEEDEQQQQQQQQEEEDEAEAQPGGSGGGDDGWVALVSAFGMSCLSRL
jgi:hypothetical protein